MTIKFGFFDSVNGDRRYTAEDMSAIFDGVISDGVFSNIDNLMAIGSPGGMTVTVDTGRAWFARTWMEVTEKETLTVSASDATNPRIDAVVLTVNKSVGTRASSIDVITGFAAASPVKPTISNGPDIYQLPLAYISVAAGSTDVATNIESVIGTPECPWVEIAAPDDKLNDWMDESQSEFNDWFDDMKDQLTVDAAGNLQTEVDELQTEVDELQTEVDELQTEVDERQLLYVPETVTNADILGGVGNLHDCDLSGLDMTHMWTLPTPSKAGLLCGLRVTKSAPSEMTLNIVRDGYVLDSVAHKGESLVYRSTGNTSADWLLAEGGEYRPMIHIPLPDLAVPADTEVELYKLYKLPNGIYTVTFNSRAMKSGLTIGSGAQFGWLTHYTFMLYLNSMNNALYNASPSEEIRISDLSVHYRTTALPTLWLNSDESYGDHYGGVTLYIKHDADCNMVSNSLQLRKMADR